jgi:hypothetical protein
MILKTLVKHLMLNEEKPTVRILLWSILILKIPNSFGISLKVLQTYSKNKIHFQYQSHKISLLDKKYNESTFIITKKM